MEIAVLGGAFNPPHSGHLLIAKQVLEFEYADEVWLMPCRHHSFCKDLIDSRHRLAMVRLIENGRIKASDFEMANRLSGDTIDTMTLLEKKFSRHHFSFVIGSDNLPCFKKWGRWQELVKKWDFYIFPRPGFDYDLRQYGLNNPRYRFKLIKHPLLATSNISSTLIRNRLEARLSIDYLLPEKVKGYIHKNKLYNCISAL